MKKKRKEIKEDAEYFRERILDEAIGAPTLGLIDYTLEEAFMKGYKRAMDSIDENTSDGYHTFKELYDYRMVYNALLVNEFARSGEVEVVKSWRHDTGEECFGGGWFVVYMMLPTGQVSNHYEEKYWDLFRCKEVERAPKWDGHTPQDALERMFKFISLQNDKIITK